MNALESLVQAMEDDLQDADLAVVGVAAVERNDLDAIARAFRVITAREAVATGTAGGGANCREGLRVLPPRTCRTAAG